MIRQTFSPRLAILTAVVLLSSCGMTSAGWGVGISVGVPFCHRPCYGPCYGPCFGPCFYRPYPVFVAPAPVYVPTVAVVQPAPVAVPAASIVTSPVPAVAQAGFADGRNGDIDRYAQQLQHPDPKERAEAAVQLGRLRALGSLTALTAALNNDRSPLVREAAARGLGLLGATDALDSLQRAASADEDRNVRHSASYAADVIRANLSRR